MLARSKSQASKAARHLTAVLHGWIGVFSSLFIFLIAATGVLLAFFGTLFQLQFGDLMQAEDGPQADIGEIVNVVEMAYPDMRIVGMFMGNTRVEGMETALIWGRDANGPDGWRFALVDETTSELKGEFDLEKSIAHEINEFHFNLLFGELGATFIAIIGILIIVFVLTGLYLWWPRGTMTVWQKLTKIQYKGRLSPKMFNWHGLSGIWLGALTIFFTFTGLGLSKPDWLAPVMADVDEPPVWDARFKEDCGDRVTISQAASLALSSFPHREISSIIVVSGTENKYHVRLRAEGDWNARFGDVYAEVHARCENEMWSTHIGEYSGKQVFSDLILTLHGGDIFGPLKEGFVVLTGLALMLLSGSGVYVFFKRTLPASVSRAAKKRKKSTGV